MTPKIKQEEVSCVFQIDVKSRKPIYAQVVDNFKRLIVSGVLPPDEKVPSVRDMAKTLTVNPNTVQKAYRELETQGYFYTVLGQGNFIAKPETSHEIEAFFSRLREAVQELTFRGVAMTEIIEAIQGRERLDKN
jgi:GntR family transcriptional regulator